MKTKNGSRTVSRRTVLTVGATATAFGIAGCVGGGDEGSSDAEELSAVNGSFFMLYDLARHVAGDQLRVEDLVPMGAHGDDWEPSPGIIEDVADADVFVYIDGFRSWSDEVAEALPSDYPNVVVIDAAEGIEHIEGETGREVDPHFWMDPLLAQDAVENIRDGFVEADPEHAPVYEENASEFIARLDDVHAQYEEAMAHREQDVVIVGSHDSFQYWSAQYDINIHSPVGISPDGEPTAGEMEEITNLVEDHNIQYILYDKYEPTSYAENLASETATDILPLSPIEATTEEQIEEGMGYVEHMLDINLETLEQALEVTYEE